uniref:Sulfotransferase n=1 Tax=Locusta migratoria migratoria TaxID=238695 RepID=A0A1B0Y0B0_LOCMI|nr:sulfotransferase [Locusta migratoria migratoria]
MSAVAVSGSVPAACADKKQDTNRPQLEFRRLDGEAGRRLDAMFGVPDCLLEVNPGRVLLPPEFKDMADRILDFTVYPDDTWLVSYPRTGSTWAQEMVWCIGNDLDFKKAKETMQQLRTPLLELSAIMVDDNKEWMKELGNSVDLVEKMARPRFIKSHLPLELLPTQIHIVKPKIVYVARNPKDMCVSYYHYCKLIHNLQGTVEEFCDLFLKDRAPVGPVWNHILGFWKKRHEPNILFLKYEEMKRDQKGAIRKTAAFLGKTLTEEQVNQLAEYLSFGNMKKNPAVNLEPIIAKKNGPEFLNKCDLRFIRKGEIGDWKNHMSEELAAHFDVWTEENIRGTGLSFD